MEFQIQIDEPCELCGTNQYASPQEYLLAATNACMMVGYATVAAVMGVKLTKLELQYTNSNWIVSVARSAEASLPS